VGGSLFAEWSGGVVILNEFVLGSNKKCRLRKRDSMN